ncbi:plasmid maintenance system antidote protein, XRE family [Magnetococcus marinus MC-1]|uniref:Plasmid maintenance system antidote protein, XRE family n=1 Tax=Magnetococcus marinus (strain ATCC BAA-1437 / JCM 17883 / MC-1) TaxID=156889 RepID=A0LBP4_MAGMM|nr:HigA family addiction module antitoxin [Magnetococcus marinus]ABK45387.1 plasmid maintenance system antidote protein, XRE family [Magnetococcus marinus MC-1]
MRVKTHPGEILKEEFLVPMGMSANALSIALRVPATRISEIIRGRRGISAETALRLARYFGTTPQFWMNLQQAYDLSLAETSVGESISNEIAPHAA